MLKVWLKILPTILIRLIKTLKQVSNKRSLFADNLNNTKSSQTQSKEDDEDTYNGYDVQDDGNANNDRVDLRRISSHKIVPKRNHWYLYAQIIIFLVGQKLSLWDILVQFSEKLFFKIVIKSKNKGI